MWLSKTWMPPPVEENVEQRIVDLGNNLDPYFDTNRMKSIKHDIQLIIVELNNGIFQARLSGQVPTLTMNIKWSKTIDLYTTCYGMAIFSPLPLISS